MKTENKSSHCALILAHLKKGNSISELEARDVFGMTSLAQRICDLRKRGVLIQDTWVNNGKTRYKRYFLGAKQ